MALVAASPRAHLSHLCGCFLQHCPSSCHVAVATLRAARTKILQAVFLSCGYGEADIPVLPVGLFVCAFSSWCAPERALCSGNVNKVTVAQGSSEGSLPRHDLPGPLWALETAGSLLLEPWSQCPGVHRTPPYPAFPR